MNELNLLPNETKFNISKIRLIKNIKKYVWGLGIVWVVVVLLIFMGLMITNELIKSEENKVVAVKKDMMGMAELVNMGDEIKYRTKQVGGVLSTRFEYYDRFEKIKSFMPLESMMVNVKLGERDKLFRVTGSSSDNNVINDLEKIVVEINDGKMENFSKANIVSINLKNGIWKYVLEVEVK